MSAITTIYVPRMSSEHDEYCVMSEFENQQIGKVSRVDFVPINKKPGFTEEVGMFVRSAFIHFDYYCNNEKSIKIMEKLCRGGNHRIDVLITTSPYDHQGHTYEYWILLKATNPIQKTMMNRHQIVENCRFLETKLDEQAEIIDKQAKIIEKLESTVNGLQNVVYQMIPRTFETGDSQNYAVDVLFGSTFKNNTVEEDDENSLSTHSSMPELVDITDYWSGSEQSSEDRIRISNELCGNE